MLSPAWKVTKAPRSGAPLAGSFALSDGWPSDSTLRDWLGCPDWTGVQDTAESVSRMSFKVAKR